MLIAICFWGLLRALPYTLQSIYEKVYAPLEARGHAVHVHVHTYKLKKRYQNLRNRELPLHINASMGLKLHPDYLIVDDQDLFDFNIDFLSYVSKGDAWSDDLYSLKNHIRALNSLSKIVESIISTKIQYDAVIFIRPDVLFLNELPVRLLEDMRPAIKEELYLADFHRSCSGGEYNDRYAMGTLAAAIKYGSRFHDAKKFSMKKAIHAESYLYDYLTLNNISVTEIPFRFRRMRQGGFTHKRDNFIISPERQLKSPRSEPSSVTKLLFPTNPLDPANIYCSPNSRMSIYDPSYSTYFIPEKEEKNI